MLTVQFAQASAPRQLSGARAAAREGQSSQIAPGVPRCRKCATSPPPTALPPFFSAPPTARSQPARVHLPAPASEGCRPLHGGRRESLALALQEGRARLKDPQPWPQRCPLSPSRPGDVPQHRASRQAEPGASAAIASTFLLGPSAPCLAPRQPRLPALTSPEPVCCPCRLVFAILHFLRNKSKRKIQTKKATSENHGLLKETRTPSPLTPSQSAPAGAPASSLARPCLPSPG